MDNLEIRRRLEPAYGYAELGLWEEASETVDSLPEEYRWHPLAEEARFEILIHQSRLDDACAAGLELIRRWPQIDSFHLKTADVFHLCKKTEKACALLREGPPSLEKSAQCRYQLAIYEASLGLLGEAKVSLRDCFQLDKGYRQKALCDPALECVWNSL